MAFDDDRAADEDNATRRKVFIIVGTAAALLLAALIFLMTRPAANVTEARLEGALRASDQTFEETRRQVVLDSIEASESPRAVGDIVMSLQATVRNFTGRTINGLEIRAAIVDSAGNPVRERTVIVLPSGQTTLTELAPNRNLPVRVMLEGFKKTDDRANYEMQITGVKFK